MFATSIRPRRALVVAGQHEIPRRQHVAGVLAVLVAVVGLTLTVSGCGGSESAAGNATPMNGAAVTGVLTANRRGAAPALAGTILGGGRIGLAQLRGQVVVLNAWGSWCAPCRAEAPTLEAVYRQTRPKGVAFLGINVRDNDAAAQSFQRTFGITYPSIPDTDGQIIASFRQLPANAIPTTLILDRQGRVAARFIGGITKDQLLPAVLALAAEPK